MNKLQIILLMLLMPPIIVTASLYIGILAADALNDERIGNYILDTTTNMCYNGCIR